MFVSFNNDKEPVDAQRFICPVSSGILMIPEVFSHHTSVDDSVKQNVPLNDYPFY